MLPNVATLNGTCGFRSKCSGDSTGSDQVFPSNGIAAHIKTGVVCEAYVVVAVLGGRSGQPLEPGSGKAS